jgi:hypothetical protein
MEIKKLFQSKKSKSLEIKFGQVCGWKKFVILTDSYFGFWYLGFTFLILSIWDGIFH